MKIYLDLLRQVLERGAASNDRTGVGTRSLFGWQSRYDLSQGFPLLTTKRVHFPSVAHELLWFIRGDTNAKSLQREGVSIWNEWADEDGELGPIYGRQWRAWRTADRGTVDQLAEVVAKIKRKPDSRRLLVSAWNVGDLPQMRLPPCHLLFQFYVRDGRLSCQFYQRSADVFLGVPFNIASYALLCLMVAHACDLQPGELVHSLGDVHLYENHIEQARTQLARVPKAQTPKVRINPAKRDLFDITYDDLELLDYDPHPGIPAPVAV